METETREAPAVVARIVSELSPALRELGATLRSAPPAHAIAVGRGSSGAAGLLAKYLFETRLGLSTASGAPSVNSIYGERLNLAHVLVLAISQSGKSPDLVEFCRAAQGANVRRVALTNDPTSPLAATVDTCLPLLAGPERSVAATKSCIAAMALVFGLAAHWRDDPLLIATLQRASGVLDAALEADWRAAEAFLLNDGPMFVVGRGPGLAIAKEAALKLKETNGLFAEAVSSAEIRHGPLALAGPGLRILMFAQNDQSFAGMRELRADLEARGCLVLFISSNAECSTAKVPADPEPVLELLAMLNRFYLAANATALARGRSPDHPPLLSKVTETR